MEYIPSPTTATILEQYRVLNGLPPSEALWTSMVGNNLVAYFNDKASIQMESFSRALHKVHECGVSHQDLALRNIILTDSDSLSGAIFLDFAFACQADKDGIKEDAYRLGFDVTPLISKAHRVCQHYQHC
jgi:tRNA A-37 threonylcarbamoyl transferase component Bud32